MDVVPAFTKSRSFPGRITSEVQFMGGLECTPTPDSIALRKCG